MKKILIAAATAAAISSSSAMITFDFEAGNPTATMFSGDASQVLADTNGNLFTLAVVESALFQSGSLNTAADFGSGGSTFVFTGPPAANGVGILQLFAGDLSGEANAAARQTATPVPFILNSFDAGNNGASTTITGSLAGGPSLFSVATDPSNTNPNTYTTFTDSNGLTIDSIQITQGATTNNVNRFDNFVITVADPIPEPSSALLLGAAGLLGLARRRR